MKVYVNIFLAFLFLIAFIGDHSLQEYIEIALAKN